MKKVFFMGVVIALIISACGKKPGNNPEGT